MLIIIMLNIGDSSETILRDSKQFRHQTAQFIFCCFIWPRTVAQPNRIPQIIRSRANPSERGAI